MNASVLFEEYYDITTPISSECRVLKIPIGVNDQGVLEHAEITEKPCQHILMAGHAGTGKSNYLHTVLGSLLLNYTAAQVNIWLSDSGTCEFNHLTDNSPAHIKRVHTSCETKSHIDFTDALDTEITCRLTHLTNAKTASFYTYCHETGNFPFPRVVIIIDHFDYFIRILSEAGPHYISKLEHIVHRAATCGITFVVSTQDALFLAQHIPCGFFDLLGIRVATKQTASSYAVLFDPNATTHVHNLKLGDIITGTSPIDKKRMLYITPQTEAKIIEKAKQLL